MSDADREKFQSEYQKKISAAKTAKVISREIQKRITMPPPPPDPEELINDTLSKELSSDLSKIVGDLLDVNVKDKLTRQVAASLKDELAIAAKDIAAGKYTEEEIKNLHQKLKYKAHPGVVQHLGAPLKHW